MSFVVELDDRLRESHPDVPLSALDYNTLEKMKSYWAGRPVSKRYGEPIAIDTSAPTSTPRGCS